MRHNPHMTFVDRSVPQEKEEGRVKTEEAEPGSAAWLKKVAESEPAEAGTPNGGLVIGEQPEPEEVPYNPPGMDEYIREGARKNSILLKKMQGKAGAGPSASDSDAASGTGGQLKDGSRSEAAVNEKNGDGGSQTRAPVSAVGELELAVPGSARAEHLAGDPRAAALQREFQVAFQKRFAVFAGGFKSLLHLFVDKAEQGRQIGVLLNEFAEVALPGKRLTLDFYRQHSAMFTDGQGQTIPLAMLEWFMKVARARGERAIVDMQTALEWQKPFLKAPEDELFTLVSDRAPGERAPQRDEWAKMVAWVEGSELPETWKALRANEAYFPGGHIREDLRETVREEWKPVFEVLEQIKKELRL